MAHCLLPIVSLLRNALQTMEKTGFWSGFTFRGNIYVALVLRLALVMALLMICRIAFYLFNTSFFPGMTLSNFLRLSAGGVRFDLAAMFYVNLLFILLMILPVPFRFSAVYERIVKWIFLVTNAIALAANVSDFVYYRFTLRRTTADVFTQFENEQNLGALVFRFLFDYWYALVFWILLVVLMGVAYNRTRVRGPLLTNKLAHYGSAVVAMLIVATLVVGGIRGGYRESTRPITLSNAGEYVKDPREISIVLNTPFAVLRTMGKTKIQKANFFPEAQLENIYTPVHLPADTAAFRPDNVVVIILESFSKEFFGVFNRQRENGAYKGYTPFLDSLVQHSLTFENSFANGRKSIDGLPSVVSSIPALGLPYFLSPYSGNRINSVASLLKDHGYHSAFFHGAPNGSMGFQAFMNIAGFQEYYGKTEYNNDDDFDGIWGIWDEKFLQFYAQKLNTFKPPFVSALFSVSSHHPFKVPEEYTARFKGGNLPIQKCIQYTDYAMRRFFAEASKMPWFKNTLFVITADHTSSDIYFDDSRTAWGFFSVPVIFYKPDNSLAAVKPGIVQQIDIMPSILGYLHYDKPYLAFGRDVFHPGNTEPFAFNYKDDVYQLFQDDYLLQFDGKRSLGFYNYKTDRMVQHNLAQQPTPEQQKMEEKIKAIIQQYNNRMVEDKLTVKEGQ
jgi:phosphoglycerol transferase MdoB-like AlkP superfamily enzyme